jgi:UDP-N-acetylmuramate dehydrogenase
VIDGLPEIRREVPLAPRTTLGVGGAAARFCEARSEADLAAAIAYARVERLPLTLLGGGSNVVVADEGVPGLVVHVALRGLHARDEGDRVLVDVAAGEPWDEVVARACDEGLAGIEALSGIPGSTGATPVQNVGAYGQEVADTIVAVRVIERATGAVRTLSPAECGFRYRHSALKARPDAYAVVAVTFALRRGDATVVRHGELGRALGGTGASPARVREAVIALRRAKSMVFDPPGSPSRDENARSAGSFFTNPVVDPVHAARVVELAVARGSVAGAEEVPRWNEPDGRVKLAAGWLVEHSGFSRGLRRGAVGLSTRHALALVCHKGATTAALLAFAEEIRAGVHARFGVTLEREPVWIGAPLHR